MIFQIDLRKDMKAVMDRLLLLYEIVPKLSDFLLSSHAGNRVFAHARHAVRFTFRVSRAHRISPLNAIACMSKNQYLI